MSSAIASSACIPLRAQLSSEGLQGLHSSQDTLKRAHCKKVVGNPVFLLTSSRICAALLDSMALFLCTATNLWPSQTPHCFARLPVGF